MRKKKVAIIGTNGIPARYGGYETLTEYLTKNLNEEVEFTVYCSNIYKRKERQKYYNGAKLIYLPLKANGFQSVIYDIISTIHAWFTKDVLLILGPSAGFIAPLNIIFRKKIIINHGGLDEWEREKYKNYQKKILKLNRSISNRFAKYHIADNLLLKESLKKTFNIDAVVIEYGGDHVVKRDVDKDLLQKHPFLELNYDLSVSRAQVDNNLHLLLNTYKDIPNRNLVIVSNWNISEYGKNLLNEFSNYPNLFLVDAVYEKTELDVIRSNTKLYIHSHSRCGTAPSLVEAMNYKIPVICYDVPVNRATTKEKSLYFNDEQSLKEILENTDEAGFDGIKESMYDIARSEFNWKTISEKYLKLFE
jgi:glycosyltransferase involved in cell wall biosynthesis